MDQRSAAIPNETMKTPPYAWVVLFATYMASLAAPMNLFKVPPMLTTLEPIFSLSQASQGNLMSVFSIMGFVLAIPAGFVLKRFGVKMTILIAVAALAIGAGMGAMAETVFLLFFGRFIEGAGMGLIMVSAPLAISMWFPAVKRGLPMGLWASCIGVGNSVMFFLGPILAEPEAGSNLYQWQKVWWLGSGFAVFAFLIFAILFRMPKEGEVQQDPAPPSSGDAPAAQPSLFKAMANKNLWLLSICFLTFNLVIMALNTFYPVFLETGGLGHTAKSASMISSLLFLIAIFSAPFGSYISDRIGSRKLIIVIPFAVIAILFLFPFSMTGTATISTYLIVMALMMGPISPVILAAVPEVMPSPATIGIGMGVAAFGQNIGMFIGPSLFGNLLESTHGNWAMVGYIMVPICLVGVITGWMAKIR